MIHLVTRIHVGTGPFADEVELIARNKIMAELERRGIGEFIGCGSGDKEMDFSFNVDDELYAREMIEELVQWYLPNVRLRIEKVGQDEATTPGNSGHGGG